MIESYNLSGIMSDAHKLYGNPFQRKGRSWAGCLESAWSWAKEDREVRIRKAGKLQALIEAAWAGRHTDSYNPYPDIHLTWEDCYTKNSKGYMGSQYCGD